MSRLEPLETVMRNLLAGLGLPAPDLLGPLSAEWDEVAGAPWAGHSHPSYLRGSELVVEASEPALISMMKYATGDLLRRLDERFGPGFVETVRVVARR